MATQKAPDITYGVPFLWEELIDNITKTVREEERDNK